MQQHHACAGDKGRVARLARLNQAQLSENQEIFWRPEIGLFFQETFVAEASSKVERRAVLNERETAATVTEPRDTQWTLLWPVCSRRSNPGEVWELVLIRPPLQSVAWQILESLHSPQLLCEARMDNLVWGKLMGEGGGQTLTLSSVC
ncbi:hypothetical protein EYF80_002258 [Liparis tanakae]|uniref:Uncharacterized protein n=1 Tax=Liparis tanakae TaxID=230148 RepID=A0A4Z2JC04_9TELE|nr:hypothetical protein EYF80_002258 [Liparis tanakae]